MEAKKVIDTATASVWEANNMLCSVAKIKDYTAVTIFDPVKASRAVWCIAQEDDPAFDPDEDPLFTWMNEGDYWYADSMKDMLDETLEADEVTESDDALVLSDFARAAYEAFRHLDQLPNDVASDLDNVIEALDSVKEPAVDLDHAIGELCETVLDWDAPTLDPYSAFRNAGFSEKKAAQLKLEYSRLVATANSLNRLYRGEKE